MKNVLLVIVSAGLLLFGFQSSAQVLLATTNQGELVEIDLVAGTATLIGDAGTLAGKPADLGWTGLSLDPAGILFAVSRQFVEPDSGDCPGSPLTTETQCSHLYRIDPNTGAVLEEIGDTQTPFLSDIDFDAFGGLFGNQYDSRGALVTVDPTTGTASIVNHFGTKFDGMGTAINLQNGGISVHPITDEIWAVESDFTIDENGVPSLFKVDAMTGVVVGEVIQLGLLDSPSTFGFDALEILPDGRFIATRGGGLSDVYEINPMPNTTTGLAEVTLIPVMLDPLIKGSLNGLEFLKESPGPIDILIDDIIALELQNRTSRRLVKILEDVQKKLSRGKLVKARSRMCDFVVELESAVARNRIEIVDANRILKDASNILGGIEFQ